MSVVDFARLPDGLKGTVQDVAFVTGSDFFVRNGRAPDSIDLDDKSPMRAVELIKQHGGIQASGRGVLPIAADEFAPKARSLLGYMLGQGITKITMPSIDVMYANVHPSSLVAKAVAAALG